MSGDSFLIKYRPWPSPGERSTHVDCKRRGQLAMMLCVHTFVLCGIVGLVDARKAAGTSPNPNAVRNLGKCGLYFERPYHKAIEVAASHTTVAADCRQICLFPAYLFRSSAHQHDILSHHSIYGSDHIRLTPPSYHPPWINHSMISSRIAGRTSRIVMASASVGMSSPPQRWKPTVLSSPSGKIASHQQSHMLISVVPSSHL